MEICYWIIGLIAILHTSEAHVSLTNILTNFSTNFLTNFFDEFFMEFFYEIF